MGTRLTDQSSTSQSMHTQRTVNVIAADDGTVLLNKEAQSITVV